MYVNLGTKPALSYHYTLPWPTNYKDSNSNTPCNHSKTIKTNGEKLHKFIIPNLTESKASKYK